MHALTKRLRGDCEKVAEERDNAVTQREQAIAECDLAIVQREQAVAECEEAIHESNQAKNDLEEVKHERDMLKAMLEQERQEYLVVKEEMFKLKLDRRLMQAKLDDSNFKVEKLRGKLAAFQEENCYQQEPSVPTTKGQEHWMSTPSMVRFWPP
jgi:chromosome segregation ATPase